MAEPRKTGAAVETNWANADYSVDLGGVRLHVSVSGNRTTKFPFSLEIMVPQHVAVPRRGRRDDEVCRVELSLNRAQLRALRDALCQADAVFARSWTR